MVLLVVAPSDVIPLPLLDNRIAYQVVVEEAHIGFLVANHEVKRTLIGASDGA